ncbi:MAG: acyltransferase family protein [Acidimicrobiia bacterium]
MTTAPSIRVDEFADPAAVGLLRSARLGYQPGLDGLRALAVSLVALSHLEFRSLRAGMLGVDLFFALSGYLITRLLLEEVRLSAKIDLRAFYARRFLRLGPPLALMLVGVSIVHLLVPSFWAIQWKGIIAAGTYLTNLLVMRDHSWSSPATDHTWSLACEEQFYLIWPVTLWFLVRRGWTVRGIIGFAVVIASISAIASAYLASLLGWDDVRLYVSPVLRGSQFLVGAVGALLMMDGDLRLADRLRARPALSRWLVLGAAAAMVALVCDPGFTEHWLVEGVALTFALLATVVVAISAEGILPSASAFLSLPPLLWLGKRSYGFYLWQVPVFMLVAYLGQDLHPVVRVGLQVPLGLLFCEISYRVAEQPVQALRRRYSPLATRSTAPEVLPS